MKHLRLICFLTLLTIFAAPHAEAQFEGDGDSVQYGERRKKTELPYFGIGGGYMGMYSIVNTDPLNRIAEGFGLDASSQNLLLNGGTAYFGLSHIRLAYFNVGGGVESSETVELNNVEYQRTFRFNRNITGVQIGVPLPIVRPVLWVIPEIMIGGMKQSIQVEQFQKGELQFDSLYNPDSFNGIRQHSNLSINSTERSFFLQPSVTVEYGLLPYFLILRAGAGYAFNFHNDWEETSGHVLQDGPTIDGNLNLHFGVSLDLAAILFYSASESVKDILN
ncbi:MAG: hypothetical protein AB7H80_12950 [Candidatus Kapaibacterium sp.]